jgi:uncharacterized surface protein with fasciclin (FAS1) repeats
MPLLAEWVFTFTTDAPRRSTQVRAAEVTSGDCLTVEGSTIDIKVGDSVVLNKTTNVIDTDIMASNGVIHVIDSVLSPPGVDAAALSNK